MPAAAKCMPTAAMTLEIVRLQRCNVRLQLQRLCKMYVHSCKRRFEVVKVHFAGFIFFLLKSKLLAAKSTFAVANKDTKHTRD